MKVKKAIEILKNQKAKIDNPNHNNDENWVFQTASFIKDFFGYESTEYSFIAQFKFYVASAPWDSQDTIRQRLADKPIEAKQFLDNCIETLEHKGLFKLTKQNFLYRLSDTAVWTIIGIAIPGLLSIGFLFGNIYSDKQNIELRQDNKLLKESLSNGKPDTTNRKKSTDTLR